MKKNIWSRILTPTVLIAALVTVITYTQATGKIPQLIYSNIFSFI